MKTIKTILSLLVLAIPAFAWQGDITIRTPNTQMLLHAWEGGDLRMAYYGDRSATLEQLRDAGADLNFSAMPAFGTVDAIEAPALQIQHADGDLNLELKVTDYASADAGNAILHTITMQDKLQPVTVKVFYKAYKNVDIIETWTEISHQEKRAITLKRYDSGHLTFRQGNVWLTHLHGNWAAETESTQERLTPGMKIIRNTDGARNSHLDAPELMLSLDGQPQENTGRTIGAALCWSGNFELRINTNAHHVHHLYAGIDPQSSEYVLEPKQTFETPHLALTYTNEGMGGVSRAFHRWARTEGMLHRGMKTGDILLNSWEGIYFDITEERIIQMMDDIAKFGGELFVMDDGWFGDKYPRNNDSSSLGDWVVDRRKLPNGIKALTDAARERGIKFGIWIEPEMSNTKSELFEKHPDWVLRGKGRELSTGRGGTQVVLDLTNPKVQDFVFHVVDDLMTENPDIAYIKWDCNAPLMDYGSPYLPADKQSQIYIDYQLGLIKTLKRIRAKYPKLVIQDCSGGGGRINYGMLPYFDEFWGSDDTDAKMRLFIQWGELNYFPAIAMGSHVSAGRNHQTHRVTPIKFRMDVAMTGRLGMELQPSQMSKEDLAFAKRGIAAYKQIRDVVQFGDLYRLHSPYDGDGVASLMYASEDKSHAAFFAYNYNFLMNQKIPAVQLGGLDPNRNYRIKDLTPWNEKKPCRLDGKVISGKTLMEVGLNLYPLINACDASVALELTAE